MGVSSSIIAPRDKCESGSLREQISTSDFQSSPLELFHISDRKKTLYRQEGIIDDTVEKLELRFFLDNKYSFGALKRIAISIGEQRIFDCWHVIFEWKNNCAVDKFANLLKHGEAREIFEKYVDNPYFVQSIDVDTSPGRIKENCFDCPIDDPHFQMKNCFRHFKFDKCKCHCADPDVVQEDSTGIAGCSFPTTGFDWLLRVLFSDIFNKIYGKLETLKCAISSRIVESQAPGMLKHSERSNSGTPSSPHTSKRIDSFGGDEAKSVRSELLLKLFELTRHVSKMNVKCFAFHKVLGEGSFGMVVLCTSIKSGKKFAMKVQRNSEIVANRENDMFDVAAESKILHHTNHPYICKLYAAFRTEVLSVLVLDYCPLGDLSQYLKSTPNQSLPELTVIACLAELCSAITYLHNHNIIHKDIKPGNIMIGSDGHIQLTDFGAATNSNNFLNDLSHEAIRPESRNSDTLFRFSLLNLGGLINTSDSIHSCNSNSGSRGPSRAKCQILRSNTYAGTDGYMAPEVSYLGSLNDGKRQHVMCYYTYTHAVDWWSVGATAYNLLTGSKCLTTKAMNEILRNYPYSDGADEYLDELINIGSHKSTKKSASLTKSEPKAPVETKMSFRGTVLGSVHGIVPLREDEDDCTNHYVHKRLYDDTALSELIPNASLRLFILQLLDVNFITRLGSGPLGSQNIKGHIVFGRVDWKLLENKRVPPIFNDLSVKTIKSASSKSKVSYLQAFRNWVSHSKSPGVNHRSPTHAVRGHRNGLLSRLWACIAKSKHITDEEFNLDFNELVVALGKESWLPKKQLGVNYSRGAYSTSDKAELLRDWDYESLDIRLLEVGLVQLCDPSD